MDMPGTLSGGPQKLKGLLQMTAANDTPRGARLLLTEDDESARRFVVYVLQNAGYSVEVTVDGMEALRALERELFDVALLDVNLPGVMGLDVLAAGRSLQTDCQFIMVTGDDAADTAVEAMKLGAFDYITKPVSADVLLLTVEKALRDSELRREVAQLRRQVVESRKTRIIGKSAALRRVHDLVDRVAPTVATVLITGETGTGKEMVARSVHEISDRARGSFVAVNCSALPESLLESELFGYVKGAFTGAIANRRGLFEEAHGGTLFLDEIATISPAIQVKLLRVLQERHIQRLGSSQPVPVDFRLIAAGNLALEEQVAAGLFREDLYYRLNVFPIHVPPLRERKEDIPLLASHFRLQFAADHGLEAPEISAETMRRLLSHDWPGNVRELENFIERSVIMHSGARTLPFEAPARRGIKGPSEGELIGKAAHARWSLDRLEREYILEVLQACHGHQVRTADILGIDRRTLYRKLKQYKEEGLWAGSVDVAEAG